MTESHLYKDFVLAVINRDEDKIKILMDQMPNSTISMYHPCFKEVGAVPLGEGAMSTVFSYGEKVYKISIRGGDSWIHWAKHSMENHQRNPMLPKIEWMLCVGNKAVACMEHLDDASVSSVIGMAAVMKNLKAGWFSRFFSTDKKKRKKKAIEYLQKEFLIRARADYNVHDLADAALAISDLLGKTECSLDCHTGNWMMRGKQLVLTDPIV